MTSEQIWDTILAELELSLSRANFVTWFKNTFIEKMENDEATIGVPSEFYRMWLEKKFHTQLVKLLEKTTGRPVRSLTYKVATKKTVVFNTPTQTQASTPAALTAKETAKIEQISQHSTSESANYFGLNPRHVFDTFVVGKTHLIQAIGNELLRQNKVKKVIYASSEKFTNEFIHSVRSGNAKAFQDAYRNADILLIDDIQFIAGKQETQEAFFHTFNALHQYEKQVVITSDRPPKAIPLLEDRLRSRFEMGMIADIASPDFETRMAILEQKCQEKSFNIEKKLLTIIASSVQNNVRELEGALNKIHAYFQLKNQAPDEMTVKSLISSLENSASKKVITSKHIIQTITEYYDIKVEEVMSAKRDKRLAYPRQIIMFLMREELSSSYPAIGSELGGRDHTTAMHAYNKISKEMEKNYKTKEEINQLKQRLYAV